MNAQISEFTSWHYEVRFLIENGNEIVADCETIEEARDVATNYAVPDYAIGRKCYILKRYANDRKAKRVS